MNLIDNGFHYGKKVVVALAENQNNLIIIDFSYCRPVYSLELIDLI